MVVIADVHSGKETDSFLVEGIPVQRLDLETRLNFVGDHCRKTNQTLIIAGDIFNKKNPISELVAVLFSFLHRYSDVNIVIIPGNHDSSTELVNMTMVEKAGLPNVTVFTKPSVATIKDSTGEANVAFYPHIPLAYRDTTESIGAFCKSADIDFCVTHGQVTDSEYSNDIFFEAGDALSLDLSTLPALTFAGHEHSHAVYTNNVSTVVYPGSLTINNFGEVDDVKGFLNVPLRDPRNYEFIPFDEALVTPWVHVEIDLTDKDETELDEEAISKCATDAIIKLTVFAKQFGVVNEIYIRELFNKYGHVSKYVTKVDDFLDTEEDTPEGRKKSHETLLAEWLNDADVSPKLKKTARTLGAKIIAEVLS